MIIRTARELLIEGVTMDLGMKREEGTSLPSREEAMASLEKSTPLQRLGYAAQGLAIWGQIVEAITLDIGAHGGALPPGKEKMVVGSRACLLVFCEAYSAALRELADASLVSP